MVFSTCWHATLRRRGKTVLHHSRKEFHPTCFATPLLRKRPLLVMRGTFEKADLLDPAPLQSACRMLVTESGPFEREPVALTELSIHHVTRVEEVSMDRMLECIRQLTPRGPVVASDYPETYLLARYLRRHSTEPVRFVLSVAAAAKTLHEAFYQNLPGTLLEGLGRLLATNVKLYVAPMPRQAFVSALQDTSGRLTVRDSADGLVALDDLIPAEPACHLLTYLRASGRIRPLGAVVFLFESARRLGFEEGRRLPRRGALGMSSFRKCPEIFEDFPCRSACASPNLTVRCRQPPSLHAFSSSVT